MKKHQDLTLSKFKEIYSAVEANVYGQNVEAVLRVLVITGVIKEIDTSLEYTYIVTTHEDKRFKSDEDTNGFEELSELDEKRVQLKKLEKEIKEICEAENAAFKVNFLDEYIQYTEHDWQSSSYNC